MELIRWHVIILICPYEIKFAQSMKQKADELDVIGWVSMIIDGSVEVLAEGYPDALREFTSYVWDELLLPSQRGINVFADESATGEFTGFMIRRWL